MKLISVEDQIIKATINALLSAGFLLSVNDGEETIVNRSLSLEEIFESMKTTDEDYLFVHNRGDNLAAHMWVRFIYGNDDVYVINDYTTNLEPIMKDIFMLINQYEATL